jgi:2-amino-4-hydroxy-6-hydroxymethyldihydropteridine diphosphokinase
VLSIGSNLGDRLAALQAAVDLLEPTVVSAVYETAPVGGPEQDDYLNAVVVCAWDAAAAWDRAQQAERAQGRERVVRWGPRTLDVDVIVADGPAPDGLVLPHPRAHQRAFVLVPWLDVDPDAELPGHGRIVELLGTIDTAGVHKRHDLRLVPHGHTSKES